MYNIALISDAKYIIPTIVTLRSLKKYRNMKCCYNIFVIISDNDDEMKIKLENESCKDFNVHIYMFDARFEDICTEHLYVSRAALIKFCLGDIFEEIDRILYLDGDILVRPGLEKIFEYDISDKYAAVVEDMNVGMGEHVKELGLKRYFNSGVMYLNLVKIREDDVKEKLFDYKKNETSHMFMDQDCFNRCFNEQVLFLPPEFNFLYDIISHFSIEEISDYYEQNKDYIENLKSNAIVLHMAGTIKPWKDINTDVFVEWLSYINDFSEFSFCLNNYNQNWLQIEDRGERNERAIGFIKSDIARIQYDYNERCDFLTEQLTNVRAQVENLTKEINILNNNINGLETENQMLTKQINENYSEFLKLNNLFPIKVFRKLFNTNKKSHRENK